MDFSRGRSVPSTRRIEGVTLTTVRAVDLQSRSEIVWGLTMLNDKTKNGDFWPYLTTNLACVLENWEATTTHYQRLSGDWIFDTSLADFQGIWVDFSTKKLIFKKLFAFYAKCVRRISILQVTSVLAYL